MVRLETAVRARADRRLGVAAVSAFGLLMVVLSTTVGNARPRPPQGPVGPASRPPLQRPIDQAPEPQDEPPVAYEYVATWASRPPLLDGRPLPWPKGHDAAGLGVDPATDRLLATDRTDNVVRVLDASRRPSGVIDASSAGGLNRPRDVAVLDNGSIVIADRGNHRVVELAPDGSLRAIVPIRHPITVVADRGVEPTADYFVLSHGDGSPFGGMVYGVASGGAVNAEIDASFVYAPEGMELLRYPDACD